MRWYPLALALVACAHEAPVATISGRMERAERLPVANVDVTLSFNDDTGASRQVRARSDFAGRFTLRVPGERMARFTAVYGGDTLTDHFVLLPPSGTLALRGIPRQARYVIMAEDSATAWGRAFNALADEELRSAMDRRMIADRLEYGAPAAGALERVQQIWRSTSVPMVRQGMGATLLLAGPRFVSSSDASAMLREIDASSQVFGTVSFTVVLRRAYARARFDGVPASELSRHQAFQTAVRTALDSVLADARTPPAVRASVRADRLLGTGFRAVH